MRAEAPALTRTNEDTVVFGKEMRHRGGGDRKALNNK